MLRKKVFEFIKQNDLVTEGQTVVAALSGGADSVCLFEILLSLRENLGVTVEAAHLNHNLRGDESDGDEDFVRALCKRHGVTLHTKSVDVKAMSEGLSLEDAARRARYDFFSNITDGRNAVVATAHTMNDNAETFFINLLRGSGGRGLCGIPKRRDGIIRPLLCATRDDIVKYLDGISQTYRTDSSNSDTVFLRNFIRHEVIPAFKKREDTDIIKSIHRATANLQRDNEALEKMAELAATDDVSKLRALDDAVLYRVLTARLEKEYQVTLDSLHFDAVKSLLSRKNSKELIRGGIYAAVSYGKLKFVKENTTPKSALTLKMGENNFYGRRILIKNVKEVYNGLTNNAIDCDKISNVLQSDIRRDGDIFYPKGRVCTSKLKKLLINDKIDKDKRDTLVLIRNGDGHVVFVEGYGADKRFAADETSKNIICIEII